MVSHRRLIVGLLFAVVFQLRAQHYPAGSEGIKCGSLPATGFYFEDQNSFYFANQMKGYGGALNHDYSYFSYTQAPRLTWMTGWKIFGAEYGVSVQVPFVYQQTTAIFPHYPWQPNVSTTKRQSGLSDIEVDPVKLGWRFGRVDVSAGYSFYAPSGDYDKNQLFLFNLGQGYWTHSFSLGGTLYFDSEKTWAASILNHYDINTEQYDSTYWNGNSLVTHGTTLGDIYTLEWAVSKTILKGVDVGLTGFYQQQITDTEGPAPNGPTWKNEKIHVAGIGPEIKGTYAKWGLSGSLRYAYEFSAMDHPQGNLITLTITKSF